MLSGIFCAVGVCIAFWGSGIFKTALDKPLDLSHPAAITFLLLMPIFMLTNAFAAIFSIMIPMHVYLKAPFSKNNSILHTIEAYSKSLKNFLEINKN